jgi:Na+-translocating ferredoxin:NAD+ oxidoreductase subunit C
VGLGGATFPSAVKLNLRRKYRLRTLVINGAECEPYLTCDDRLMREQAMAVLDGIRIMAHALGVSRILIGIEGNKPEAQQAMAEAARGPARIPHEIRVLSLPLRYPMGSEKHLVQTLTGRETPARGLTADIGVVVHNPATAFAVHEALRLGRPLVSRVVTVSGGRHRLSPPTCGCPRHPVQRLIEHCGGFRSEPARLVSGGPMMGQPLPEHPGADGQGIQRHPSPDRRGERAREPSPASAARAAWRLPLRPAAPGDGGPRPGRRPGGAVRLGLMDCIGCGSCAYVCPAHIPLVQYFNYAKGEMAARGRAKQKQTETRGSPSSAPRASRPSSGPSARPWRRASGSGRRAEGPQAAEAGGGGVTTPGRPARAWSRSLRPRRQSASGAPWCW